MNDTKINGEKALGRWVYRSFSLLIQVAVFILLLMAGLWLKNNVPSKKDFDTMQDSVKDQFKELQSQVNGLDRSLLQLGETKKHIEDFEQRIRKLEQGDTRRFPPPRP